jgi:predicted DNA-binding protein
MLYTALYMAGSMRTQIYISTDQRSKLDALRERSGKSMAQLIREAIDAQLEREAPNAVEALDATYGSMPDLAVPSRDEWDRGYG